MRYPLPTLLKITPLLLLFATSHGLLGAEPPTLDPSPEQILSAHRVALTEHAVIAALRSKDGDIRGSAAQLLAQRQSKAAVPAIERAVRIEREGGVRIAMARDLADLNDPVGRKTLTDECYDKSEQGNIRIYAATTMSRDLNDDSCLSYVLDVLQADGDPKDDGVKEMALDLVPVMINRVDRAQSQKLFELLTKSLRDPVPHLRIVASATISNMGEVRAIPALQAAIAAETDEGCRDWMKRMLEGLQRGSKSQQQ